MTKPGMRGGVMSRRKWSYSSDSPRTTRSPVITTISGSGSSRWIAATARARKAAVSTGPNPAGVRGDLPGATMWRSDNWAMIIRSPPRSIPRRRRLARQHEHALFGEQVGEAAARVKRERAAVPVQGHAAFDLGADLVAQPDKVADRAEMDVWGVVPGIVQQL